MRAFLAGTFLLVFASVAFGQLDVSGGVESIGFDQNFRPDCWTPMLINLTSKNAEPGDFEIQVEQEDLDGDTVVFTRAVTLNAKTQQKYWVYFLPSTRISTLDFPVTTAQLKQLLRVNLYTMGGKLVCNIPLTPGAGMANLDPDISRFSRTGPGKKLVLAVIGDGGSPSWRDYVDSIGLIEDVLFVPIRTSDLPENPLGYGAVDAIVWLNADASELASSHKIQAIDQWVSEGGTLVVCHSPEQNRIEAFADWLPIRLKTESGDKAVVTVNCLRPEPLHRIAKATSRLPAVLDKWDQIPKDTKFQIARATARPGAVVDEWIDWDAAQPEGLPATGPTTRAANVSPYIARLSRGLGAVTWVGQDLSSPTVTRRDLQGWPYIWDAVFGWKNETRTRGFIEAKADLGDKNDEAAFARASPVNIGGSTRGDAKFDSKAGAYIALAILFFIGYWVVAGPGAYFFLAGKRRKQFNWQLFAGCAILATALTVGVVKLVLRGQPEVKHFSIVQMTEGKPALVYSRVGLYIPRDGMQEIKLTGATPNDVSTIHALAEQPDEVKDRQGFTDTGKYSIPVHDNTGDGEVTVNVPFRSTLKKLQARWIGDVPFPIAAQGARPALVQPIELKVPGKPAVRRGTITGTLVNNSDGPLRNVFFAFKHARGQDYLFFVPEWDKGATLNLELAYNEAKRLNLVQETPQLNRAFSGLLSPAQWGGYWHSGMHPSALGSNSLDDSKKDVRIYLALMSVFDRVAPARNDNINGVILDRGDILRRGGRKLDLCAALNAGDLLILAESGSAANPVPLPFPLEVNGEKVAGNGSIYYQFEMRLDRDAIADDDPVSNKSPDNAK